MVAVVGHDASDKDAHWMRQALALACRAEEAGEVPVGALVVSDDGVIAKAHNQSITLNDPSAHAEMLALRKAATYQQNYRLNECTLYVTLEPCLMCVGAMVHARIKRLVYAAAEPRSGVICSALSIDDMQFLNHRFECTGGVLADESAALMQRFFRARR